jgi:PAS domain S-box-containing protein
MRSVLFRALIILFLLPISWNTRSEEVRLTSGILAVRPQAEIQRRWQPLADYDYSPVENLLKELRLPPFDIMPTFALRDVWVRYRYPFTAWSIAGVIIMFLAVRLVLINRNLTVARRESCDHAEKLAAILDNVGGYIYIKDSNYRYQFVNRATAELFGLSPEDILGRNDSELFDDETADLLRINDRRIIEDGERIEVMETNVFRSNQVTRTYLSVKLPLRRKDGSIYALCGISTDITERHRIEKALQESEEKLRNLYQLSPLGIAMTDMKGHFIEFNEAFRAICGYSEEQLKTLDYWTLTPPEYTEDEMNQLDSLQRTGRYGPYEKEYVRKNGQRIWQLPIINIPLLANCI